MFFDEGFESASGAIQFFLESDGMRCTTGIAKSFSSFSHFIDERVQRVLGRFTRPLAHVVRPDAVQNKFARTRIGHFQRKLSILSLGDFTTYVQ